MGCGCGKKFTGSRPSSSAQVVSAGYAKKPASAAKVINSAPAPNLRINIPRAARSKV